MKRLITLLVSITILFLVAVGAISYFLYQDIFYIVKPGMKVENSILKIDKDRDGILDSADIVAGARNEIANKTKYKSEYYVGGYPPKSEGVCTDVIWRALMNAGYNLKDDMDKDIANNLNKYLRIENSPDPNIDFRRVPNQFAFFKRNSTSLTLEVKPYDLENLKQWQPGDIVVLENPDHVAVVSDKRRKDGVPYIIHNANSYPKEQNLLGYWSNKSRIIGHFRYSKE